MPKKTKKMRRGGEPQFRTDESGRRGQAAYYSHVAPKAARKQLKKQTAAGGPARGAVRGAGGAKAGGVIKTKKMQAGRMATAGPNVSGPSGLAAMNLRRQGMQRSGLAGRPGGGYTPYGGASQQTGPERPNPPGQRASGPEASRGAEARAGQQAGLQRQYERGRHTPQIRTPPPPPPKIRPGMKKGGSVPSYNDLIRSKGW